MLTIIAVVLPGALLIGWLTGGHLRNIERVKIRVPGLGLAALAAGLLPLLVQMSHGLSTILLVTAYALIAGFLLLNIRDKRGLLRVGVLVLILGWLLNAAPIVTNGAMPLSMWAYKKSGLTETPTPRQGGFYKIKLASPATRLNWLGDTIPIASVHQVVSIGDLVLVLGVGLFLVGSMRNHREMESSAQR